MARRRQLAHLILTAAVLLGCKDTVSSDGGGLAINVQFSESAANVSFDAARIRVIGETNRMVNSTPGAEEVIEGLAPGTYRVVLEGLQGNEVELLGQRNDVPVTAGNVTDVSITLSSFVPILDPAPVTSPTLRFDVEYGPVPGASSYVIEADVDENFTSPTEVTSNTTEAEVPGEQGQTYYVRVRAVTEFATVSAPSDPEVFVVQPEVANVVVTPADLDTLIGAGDTVQFAATTQDAKGDEFVGPGFTWESSVGTVALVDAEGRVVAQGNGTSTISATADGIEGSGSFTSATIQADSGLYFPYDILFRPMGLAFDGAAYWTVNGGNAASGRIQSFDADGNILDSILVNLDMRGIYYREQDGFIYIKDWGLNWYRLERPARTITPLETGIFVEAQSSPALMPDGMTIYERVNNDARVLAFDTKAQVDVVSGFAGSAVFQFQVSIATDGNLLYTWDETATVHVFDLEGRPVTQFPLSMPVPGTAAGFSISYTKGMLWVIDTGTQTGTWYGFRLSKAPPPTSVGPIAAPAQISGKGAPVSMCRSGDTALCR